MAKDRLSDTLAVILHADIAGSTELVQQDKQLAHERIRDSFRHFGDFIEQSNGKVLEVRGDALLASFERGADAVNAALAFQAGQSERNTLIEDDLRPSVRVGISMGEVIIADNTVTGAGVVQAQRVEQLAAPGGVCITASIHESLSKRMPFVFESLGERELKGFDHAVHVYRVESTSTGQIPLTTNSAISPRKNSNRSAMVAIALITAILIAGIAYFAQDDPLLPPLSDDSPLIEKPSIAVLPFTNLSNNPEQEYFVDGMTEDLITDLSKLSGLFVIARNSVFIYKGKTVDIPKVARDLGVRYVVEGSVQRAGNTIRVNAQLIDATTEGHIWADRYDGVLDDVFTMRDGITAKIVSALEVTLTPREEAQQAQHATESGEAHDVFLQGWAKYTQRSQGDLARSIPYLEEAIKLDPDYADAHAVLAGVYRDAVENDWVFDLGIPTFEAEDRAAHHLQEALKTPNLLAYSLNSRILLAQGRTEEALREAEKAVDLDPNSATASAALANILILTGRSREGLDAIQKAMRQDPNNSPRYLVMEGSAYFDLGQFESAKIRFERALKSDPDSETTLIYLASTQGHLGNLAEADATIRKTNELRAKNSLSALHLESNIIGGCPPIDNGFDFPRFGSQPVQDRLRLGLATIPTLNWESLISRSASDAPENTYDSPIGEWSHRAQGPDCVMDKGKTFIIDENHATHTYNQGRIFFIENDDPRTWRGFWAEGNLPLGADTQLSCSELKDGTSFWGDLTLRFNETYTYWKGEFNICGEGRIYPWDGFRH